MAYFADLRYDVFRGLEHRAMKYALIAFGLLATTGVVYAACVFCP
jgi:hypothetical protein